MEFTVARTFSSFYIVLDITWLLVFAGVLLYFRKRTAVVVGLIMGVVYFLVDYGIFYHLLGTRHITGADPFVAIHPGVGTLRRPGRLAGVG